jgi:ABC-type polar amino acid transport system ATPase subunit
LLLLEIETDFLHPDEQQRVLDYILSKDWTVLASTRDMDFIEQTERVVFMDLGKIAFDGSFEEFNKSSYAEPFR